MMVTFVTAGANHCRRDAWRGLAAGAIPGRDICAHYGNMGYTGVVTEPAVIETDDRSRAVLPGRPNQRFVMRENPDGSLLLQPARVVTDAQHEFDSDPQLRDLLARAAASPTVRRARARRT
jgi:hypothetical protein